MRKAVTVAWTETLIQTEMRAALAPSIDDFHSHVTIEQKSREDAVPNSAIERETWWTVSRPLGARPYLRSTTRSSLSDSLRNTS